MTDLDAGLREAAVGLLFDASPETLPGRLAVSGFLDVLADEPIPTIRAFFLEQGRHVVASPALDLVAAHGLGVELPVDVAMLFPRVGANDAPAGRLDGGHVLVAGTALSGMRRAAQLLVAYPAGAATLGAMTPLSGLAVEPMAGLDVELGLSDVSGRIAEPEGFPVDLVGGLALCRCALAWELIGVAEAILELAVGHVTTRHQFGKAIGANQAVKHRLADVRVAIAAAAEVASDIDRTPDYWQGAAAKALAGRAALAASAAAQQVCGGMGFSREFPLHRMIRRAHMLDALLGSRDQLVFELGDRISRQCDVPVLVHL